ncbi:hypothetical protein [Shewanella surugensis]|uniref:Uncharacterized protein n=1 Tax=Shewanella surugensis TaxID=212020 RepID=A0ABT0LJR1_9GAMM|nr:hypothetical protein [Shewanella surugensis]MCL1127824.1 hypothetical protein [Shewanella surugensis]
MKVLTLSSLILATTIPFFCFSAEFEAGTSGGYGGTPFIDTVPSDYLQLRSVTICAGSLINKR